MATRFPSTGCSPQWATGGPAEAPSPLNRILRSPPDSRNATFGPVPRRSSRAAIADLVLEAVVGRPVAVGATNHTLFRH